MTMTKAFQNIFVVVALFAGSLILSSCSTVPPATKVYETQDVETRVLVDKLSKPITITESTVIIDARTSFDFSMTHIPGSINLSWTDFAESKSEVPGLLKSDLFAETRRLARMGIGPDTPVVVAGYGPNGSGDDGRLAWTLLYLGIKDVQLAQIDALGMSYSNLINPPPKTSMAIWKPKVASKLIADRKEIVKVGTSAAHDRFHIIDVRTEKEYLQRASDGGPYMLPDLRALNVPWTEFFTTKGRPNMNVVAKLRGIQILPEDRVLIISNRGIRSGAAAFALTSMGYKNVGNYAGGWSELVYDAKKHKRRK